MLHIIFKHILPNALDAVIVQVSLATAFAILAEAALSFLGLGTQPPAPSWGSMLSFGRQYMLEAPWPPMPRPRSEHVQRRHLSIPITASG